MPIISKVQAKTVQGRLTIAAIFAILTLGAITMIYPFAIMVSGSVRSEMDETDLDLIPPFLFEDHVLYRKFLETKYNQRVNELNQAHLQQNYSFEDAVVPEEINPEKVSDFQAFHEDHGLPRHWQLLGGIRGDRTVPEALRELRNRVADRFDNDLAAYNRATGGVIDNWINLVIPPTEWLSFRFDVPDDPLFQEYFKMMEEAPLAERAVVSVSGYFLETMIYPVYGQSDTDTFNAAHQGIHIDSYDDFRLPMRAPPENQPEFRQEWIEFVRDEINPTFVVLHGVSDESYRDYLEELYGTIDELNLAWTGEKEDFDEITLPGGEWLSGSRRADYHDFFHDLDPENYRLSGPEFAFREWLENQYGSIDRLNDSYGTSYDSYRDVFPPMADLELQHVLANTGSLRWTYSVRNFVNVFDALFLRGRAFLNTVIFCSLSVGLALLVNPLAAYSLSRFKLPGSYKILLLLMATMAFPPMVTLIPTFIILQNLGLMNTFAALVLPTVANGYLIFLLKGFFDSLPSELYEAATIDGASEIRIFFQITMALSKPILAVVALQAFNSAYTLFLYALLVAPSQDMWLLSVWLYQFQETASMGGIFASVLIASVPTIIIFLFAQNIIMRGIVIPVEK